jgi:hypothetical protein
MTLGDSRTSSRSFCSSTVSIFVNTSRLPWSLEIFYYQFYQHIDACVLPPFGMFDQPLKRILPCPNDSVQPEFDARLLEIAELSFASQP